MINCVEKLFLRENTTMFANQDIFIIHQKNFDCNKNLEEEEEDNSTPEETLLEQECTSFLAKMYPKNKVLYLVTKILANRNMLNENLFFLSFPSVHLADFCSFINNKFGKKEKTDKKIFKICKELQNQGIKFPRITIKNPVAQRLLT